MDPLLTASLWALLSAVFFQFVSTAQINITAVAGQDLILPCRDSDKGTIVLLEWTRTDLGSGPVLRFRDEKIDKVHPSFGNRLDLQDKQMKDGDVSLVLKDATTKDTGTYKCLTVQRGRNPEEKSLNIIDLHVSPLPPPPPPEPFPSWATALLVLVLVGAAAGLLYNFRHCFMSEYHVDVDSGEESVLLPCRTRPLLPGDARVEWKDSRDRKVHVYENGSDHPEERNQFYKNRTNMKRNLLRTGDLSLTLEHPTDEDTDIYTCSVSRGEGNILMKKEVDLRVKVQQVVEDSGKESVLLPCKTTVTLPEDARVEWMDRGDRTVHVYENGSDHPEEQDQLYRNRTKMNEDLLRTGDFSLTLEHPTDGDTNIYTCIVSRGNGDILMKKQVDLKVKVPQVLEVDSGKESVLLPCRTTVTLDGDVRVEWRDRKNRRAHVYVHGSDHPEELDKRYRNRTKMNEDLLRTGDLSLILEHPTNRDINIYTCIVFSRDGNILMKKQIDLQVKGHRVEVEEGVESVLLPFTTSGLPGEAGVFWWDKDSSRVHLFENGSDQPGEQDQLYRNRTRMNKDPLTSGDVSLTLMHPTEEDSGEYRCRVKRRGELWRGKNIQLKVKVHQVEVEQGAESVLLPFTTSPGLPEEARVVWMDKKDRKVHVYQKGENGSDHPKEQDQLYRNRTRMKEDPLRTGDLSLTLMRPTEKDSGVYFCRVLTDSRLMRRKTVYVTVKAGRVQDQNQPEDTRTRTSSTDPTPLMADQSV